MIKSVLEKENIKKEESKYIQNFTTICLTHFTNKIFKLKYNNKK